jgi:heme-degrading monooxygenase HmoA
MILRLWHARAEPARADEYTQFVTANVFPALRKIEGHRGAWLLRRAADNEIEFVVFTLWDSMDAVRLFAGADADRAVVEPEAQAALTGFDEFVTHFEVVHAPE